MRFPLLIAVCAVPLLSSLSHAQDAPLLPMVDGEIQLSGTLQNVDVTANRLEMLASSFTLPNGKSNFLPAAKPKIVQLSPQSALWVRDDLQRGDKSRPLAMTELKIGKTPLSLVVVGRDGGNGQTLQARVVAVWDSTQNQRFLFAGRQKLVAVATTATTATTVAPKDLPNVVLHSDFETPENNEKVADWNFGDRKNSQIIENDAGHYISLTSSGITGKIARTIPLDPTWKNLKLSARVRGRDLQAGKEQWQRAVIGFAFHSEDKQVLRNDAPIAFHTDTDWSRRSGVVFIPTGAVSVELTAANLGPEGTLDVDDILVQHDVAPDAPPLAPDFPAGNFETLDASGAPLGWRVERDKRFSVVAENGNHFLRLTNPTSDYLGLDSSWQLDPQTRTLRISARMRANNLKTGTQPWETARLSIVFEDKNGQRTEGAYPPMLELKQNSDWQTLTQTMRVPTTAAFLKLTPQFLNASGVMDIDNIKIEQLP